MDGHSIVIIARSGDAPALQRFLAGDVAVGVFSDSGALRAFDAILRRPPRLLVLAPEFVATARGATLIARLKTEPDLADVHVRVLIEEDHLLKMLAHPVMGLERALLKGSLPLDHWGTRNARRIPITGVFSASVNGNDCELIDLSVAGAQLVVPARLRPAQAVRMTLCDGPTQMRCRAVVAWATAEPAGVAMQYRVGVTFIDPNMDTLDAWCAQYASPSAVPDDAT